MLNQNICIDIRFDPMTFRGRGNRTTNWAIEVATKMHDIYVYKRKAIAIFVRENHFNFLF